MYFASTKNMDKATYVPRFIRSRSSEPVFVHRYVPFLAYLMCRFVPFTAVTAAGTFGVGCVVLYPASGRVQMHFCTIC